MSSVTIAAIAVLESPRSPPDKPKSYIFDGQLWLDSERPLVAGFRYFNTNNDTFGEAPICCMIVANIARYSEKLFPALYSLLDKGDYDIIGDIVYLIPLPDGTDPRHAPYVHVAGTVEHSNGSECFINSSAHLIGIETSENLSFPVTGYFPDSPRYKHGKKPVPRERTITAFGGWLTGTTGRSEHMAPETFRAQVESVAFLGHSAQVVPHPFQTESTDKNGIPKKLKFDYTSFAPPTSGVTQAKSSSEPESKKRRKLRSSDDVASTSHTSTTSP